MHGCVVTQVKLTKSLLQPRQQTAQIQIHSVSHSVSSTLFVFFLFFFFLFLFFFFLFLFFFFFFLFLFFFFIFLFFFFLFLFLFLFFFFFFFSSSVCIRTIPPLPQTQLSSPQTTRGICATGRRPPCPVHPHPLRRAGRESCAARLMRAKRAARAPHRVRDHWFGSGDLSSFKSMTCSERQLDDFLEGTISSLAATVAPGHV